MKTYSKSELIEKSKEVFEFNKKEEQLIAVSDGQFFLTSAKSLAIDHANKNGLELHTISKDEKAEDKVESGEANKPKLA